MNATITVSVVIIIIRRASIMFRYDYNDYDDNKKVMSLLHKCVSHIVFMLCMWILFEFLCAFSVCDPVLILVKPVPIGYPIKCLSMSLFSINEMTKCQFWEVSISALLHTAVRNDSEAFYHTRICFCSTVLSWWKRGNGGKFINA